MSEAIEGLKPEGLWKYFAEIAHIPRGSKNEAAISKYIYQTAKRLGLEAKADRFGNVVVRKPASARRESTRQVCLQAHLDMVCEKNADKVHNFMKDPIQLVRKDNVLMANGTTLGADNGIGVATNLAIMEDRTLEHGPLEFLFTVDEETGLTGANNLEPGFVESRTMINLDSEEEGCLTVGCAGGKDTTGIWKLELQQAPANTAVVQVTAKGLKGGHSGLEINKGRGNALKILNRVLVPLTRLGARVTSINGGNKHNAIPREAEAILYVPEKSLEEAKATLEKLTATLKAEIATVDPDLSVAMTVLRARKGKVFKPTLQKKVLQTITAIPHGVVKMSADIPSLVETSTNLAIVTTSKKDLQIVTSQRSSVASEITEIADTVRTIFEMGGAEVKGGVGYPGWKPNMSSEILQIAKSTHQSLYGKEPEVMAVHAGLECGVIGEKHPGMDMVSLGPTLKEVHSPDEKVYIDTVERFWTYLLTTLRNFQ